MIVQHNLCLFIHNFIASGPLSGSADTYVRGSTIVGHMFHSLWSFNIIMVGVLHGISTEVSNKGIDSMRLAESFISYAFVTQI